MPHKGHKSLQSIFAFLMSDTVQWGINENLMIFERGKIQANNEEKKDVKIDVFLIQQLYSSLKLR